MLRTIYGVDLIQPLFRTFKTLPLPSLDPQLILSFDQKRSRSIIPWQRESYKPAATFRFSQGIFAI